MVLIFIMNVLDTYIFHIFGNDNSIRLICYNSIWMGLVMGMLYNFGLGYWKVLITVMLYGFVIIIVTIVDVARVLGD